MSRSIRLPVRLLLDSASEVSLISRDTTDYLRLNWTPLSIPIAGISGNKNMNTIGIATLTLQSRFSRQAITINALIIHRILGNVPTHNMKFSEQERHQLKIGLADPTWNKSAPIDVLIGAQPTLKSFTDEAAIQHQQLTLRNTIFGWVVTGTMQTPHEHPHIRAVTHYKKDDSGDINGNLDRLLRRFWEMEELQTPIPTSDEMESESHYQTTTTRLQTGRYIVRLPFNNKQMQLGESLQQALRRLYNLERRLGSDLHLRAAYNECMYEYIKLGHMTAVTEQDKQKDHMHSYYIPHHAVFKPTSTTTKLRVVFDASAKTTSGVALNDKLLVGPNIQADIFTILSRFRSFRVAMSADITKMYRQVRVDNDSAQYQRIVWRFSSNDKVTEYKLMTITFGTASAPFQAVRTLHQMAQDEAAISHSAAAAIINNFYVDDYLGGADNLAAAAILKKNIMQILERGGMQLRGWKSNAPQLSQHNKHIKQLSTLENADSSTVLGLQWNTKLDCLSFDINLPSHDDYTKRTFLAATSKVFDPLGFLAPVTIITKVQFQRLWTSGIGWDDPIPQDIAELWRNHSQQLRELSAVHITRFLGAETHQLQLIGFADASETAYAAVVYSRSKHPDEHGTHTITLVAARTRVAPLKQVTLPRLELCAADLLARLLHKVATSLDIDLKCCFAFTDSQVVLAWLSDNPRRWKTFVANRTANIIGIIPPDRWGHIPTKLNPADCASRGMEPSRLMQHSLWWNGPSILRTELNFGRQLSVKADSQTSDIAAETRKVHTVQVHQPAIAVTQFSSYEKLLRTTALCQRFINNCRTSTSERNSGFITTAELNTARTTWLRLAQCESFTAERLTIQQGKPLKRKHQLRSIDPFLDEDGLLRITGRLGNSNLTYVERHPVILHRNHHLTRLIVEYQHQIHLHANFRLLQTTLSKQYWIIGARIIVKQVIRSCKTCIRNRGNTMQQRMAQLPAVRVTPSRAFINCGVDYAGPIIIKSWRGRCGKQYKAYIALFICLCTKAVHLEAVTELSTDCFLAALKRFISRRGVPTDIYSDNGTNFHGANRELTKLFEFLKADSVAHKINKFLAIQNIQWHFIPPAAPHFGGIWEAGVKTVKYHLTRAIGQASLTFEELATLLGQIEYCMNSRPLHSTSGQSDDFDCLTPNHFLIGSSGPLIPDIGHDTTKPNLIRRWRYVQRIFNDIWKRWKDDYLRQIQQRNKWTTPHPNLQIGDMVLITNENTPAATWPLARVKAIHPGTDGNIRVVTLRTANGEFKRPITKLVLFQQ